MVVSPAHLGHHVLAAALGLEELHREGVAVLKVGSLSPRGGEVGTKLLLGGTAFLQLDLPRGTKGSRVRRVCHTWDQGKQGGEGMPHVAPRAVRREGPTD